MFATRNKVLPIDVYFHSCTVQIHGISIRGRWFYNYYRCTFLNCDLIKLRYKGQPDTIYNYISEYTRTGAKLFNF